MRQAKKGSDTDIPTRTAIGAIFILVGILSLVTQSGLFPASILLQSQEIQASPGQQVILRYNYVNEGTAQERFLSEIRQPERQELGVLAKQSFPLSPKTIFTGILKFQAPVTPGDYTYTLTVLGDSGKQETAQFKVVVR